jgi:hypothetical protein
MKSFDMKLSREKFMASGKPIFKITANLSMQTMMKKPAKKSSIILRNTIINRYKLKRLPKNWMFPKKQSKKRLKSSTWPTLCIAVRQNTIHLMISA